MAVDPNMDKAGLAADGLASELNKVANEAKKFATTMNAINEKIKKAANLTEEELSEASKHINGVAKEAEKTKRLFLIFNKNAVVVGSNFNSLARTVNNFKTRVDQTFKNDQIRRFNSVLLGVGQVATDLRNTVFGLQKEISTTFATGMRTAIGAFTNQITSFFSLGGPPVTFQESIDAINAFQQEFGGILTRGEAQKIAQASKDLGVSAAVFLKAQRNFLVVGGDVTKNTFIGQFRAAGLTAANALKFAAENANLVAIAGVKYAGALAQAAANAQRIGVGLDRTEALADGIVGDFEGALERFSELRAMGVEVDFNRLAAVAGTGTPQEVLSELQGQLGGNQQLLQELQRNRFLKVALERDLGLNVAEITRLAAGDSAVATEETQEEKQSGLTERVLERVGTVISAIGLLNFNILANTAAVAANTISQFRKLGTGPTLLPAGPKALPAGPTLLPAGPKALPAGPAPITRADRLLPAQSTVATRQFNAGPQGPSITGRPGIPAGQFPPAPISSTIPVTPAGQAVMTAQTGQLVQLQRASTAQTSQLVQLQKASSSTVLQGGNFSNVARAEVMSVDGKLTSAGRMSQITGGARSGAGGGAGMGALTGAFSAYSEYKESGSIGRAVAKGLAAMLGSIIGGMLGGALSVIFPPLAPLFIGVGSMAGAYVADKLVGAIMGSPKAMGGLITGPGTATSDNILTPTSPGEYVVNAKATKAYGSDMLENINKGTFSPTQAPAVNNVVNVNMDKMEAKLDKLASAFSGMKIEMDGNTVGRVSLNARSPLDRLSVVG